MKRLVSILGIGFSLLALASCANKESDSKTSTTTVEDDYKLKVVCPNGAPIIGIADAVTKLSNNIDTENIGVSASTLKGFFTASESDIIVAPLNLGQTLFNKNMSTYKIASVITWGNTYFASQTAFEVDDLDGKAVTLFGENSINSFVALYILNEKNITPSSITYETDAAGTKNTLLASEEAYVMTAEPALSAAKTSLAKDNITPTTYAIKDLYKELTSYDMPQAAIFVNPNTITNHKALVDSFLAKIDETDTLCETNPSDIASEAIALGLETPLAVLTKAVPNCGVDYKNASTVKQEINFISTESKRYYDLGITTTDYFSGVPTDEFYYA